MSKKPVGPRPIILESRSNRDGQMKSSSNVLERRDIEDIAHSILTGSSIGSRGLGGNYSIDSAPPTLTSSLLRTQYLSSSAAGLNLSSGTGMGLGTPANVAGRSLRFMDASISGAHSHKMSMVGSSRTPSKKLPRYSLQSGYDKYVALPTSAQTNDQQLNRPKIVTPQHVDMLLPLKESIMNTANVKRLADSGLYMSRSFRVGWSKEWALANPGTSLQHPDITDKHPTQVCIEKQTITSFGSVNQEQVASLESWLEVSLENSRVNKIL